jgi:hypothetical protein
MAGPGEDFSPSSESVLPADKRNTCIEECSFCLRQPVNCQRRPESRKWPSTRVEGVKPALNPLIRERNYRRFAWSLPCSSGTGKAWDKGALCPQREH